MDKSIWMRLVWRTHRAISATKDRMGAATSREVRPLRNAVLNQARFLCALLRIVRGGGVEADNEFE